MGFRFDERGGGIQVSGKHTRKANQMVRKV